MVVAVGGRVGIVVNFEEMFFMFRYFIFLNKI